MTGILQQPPSLGLLPGDRDDLGPSEWLFWSLLKGSVSSPRQRGWQQPWE